MIGLEDRLRRVIGVADLTIELGEEGLDSIRVRIDDDSDEGTVLEEIRRILVAYGLRSRRPSKDLESEIVTATEVGSEPGGRPRILVGPRGSGLVVKLSADDRQVEATGERSPIGVAEAMVRAVAEWEGEMDPERIAVSLDELDGVPVVTILARREGRTAVACASCSVSLAGGIYNAADTVLRELSLPH